MSTDVIMQPAQAGDAAMFTERMTVLRSLLESEGPWPLDNVRVLDIGCGHGHDLARLRSWGARDHNLYGVDLSEERIAVARATYPAMRFECRSADSLATADGFFDLVLMCTVMSSVLDDTIAGGIAREVDRVLRPGGSVAWYDFRYSSPRNPHTRPMTRQHVRRYFPQYEHHGGATTLLPPLARRLGRLTGLAYPALAAVPVLRSHYMFLMKKK